MDKSKCDETARKIEELRDSVMTMTGDEGDNELYEAAALLGKAATKVRDAGKWDRGN